MGHAKGERQRARARPAVREEPETCPLSRTDDEDVSPVPATFFNASCASASFETRSGSPRMTPSQGGRWAWAQARAAVGIGFANLLGGYVRLVRWEIAMTGTLDETGRPYGVLIGEADARLREALRSVFHPPRFATSMAQSGCEAVEIARQGQLHLVIMDVRLTELGGIDAYRAIRRFNRVLPCIFISDDTRRRTRMAALYESAYTLVRKPVDMGHLRFVVDELLVKRYETQL